MNFKWSPRISFGTWLCRRRRSRTMQSASTRPHCAPSTRRARSVLSFGIFQKIELGTFQTKTRDGRLKELDNARKEQENAMLAAAQRKLKFEETDQHKQVWFASFYTWPLFNPFYLARIMPSWTTWSARQNGSMKAFSKRPKCNVLNKRTRLRWVNKTKLIKTNSVFSKRVN